MFWKRKIVFIELHILRSLSRFYEFCFSIVEKKKNVVVNALNACYQKYNLIVLMSNKLIVLMSKNYFSEVIYQGKKETSSYTGT